MGLFVQAVKDVYKHPNPTGWVVYLNPDSSVLDLLPRC